MTQRKVMIAAGFAVLAILLIIFKYIATPDESVKAANTPKQTTTPESALNTVYLDHDSYQKLGILLASIQRETIPANKVYGGEIVVPAGGMVSISAPVSGKLISIDKNLLKPGAQVKAGQLLYRIQPIITADARANLANALADAESSVKVAKSQVDAAEISLNRANKLLKDLVGSQRNVDDANAAHEIALRNLEAAHAKRDALHRVVNLGTVEAIDVKAPQAGIISNIFAITDQLVSAGSPVMQISELNALWVRVPVPAGDLNTIDQQAEARVQLSSAATSSAAPSQAVPSIAAKPISAPPTADPLTSTTHLYYAVQNDQQALRPMQRVSVALNTHSKSINALTVPWSAVVLDIYGGSWVYAQQSSQLYARKRVFVDHVSGDQAIISEGPPEGTKIVVNGALELFAVETGFTH